MGLRDRLSRKNDESSPEGNTPTPEVSSHRSSVYQQVKASLHQQLIEQIDSARETIEDNPQTRQQIRGLMIQLLEDENPPLNTEERRRLLDDLEHETFGLGPLEPLLQDQEISDILVNRHDEVFVEKGGKLELTDVCFRDDAHLMRVIERIVNHVGRRIDESCPMVDARLQDGSRINAIIPPLAVDGPVLSIRRSRQAPVSMDDYLKKESMSRLMGQVIEAAVSARMNILISGGSGSGKTTLLNAMVQFIDPTERVVSVEDTVELKMTEHHVVRLETRPPNVEGQGEISQRDLIRNALRMRPDRILVGEVRGPEAFDMLQAMNTGHKGSIATVHANSPRDALARLETMILMAGVNFTSEGMRKQISSAIDIVIQVHRFADGVRRIVSISEVVGLEQDMINIQEIIKFKQAPSSAYNQVRGQFVTTGVIPNFLEELKQVGITLPANLFAATGMPHPMSGPE